MLHVCCCFFVFSAVQPAVTAIYIKQYAAFFQPNGFERLWKLCMMSNCFTSSTVFSRVYNTFFFFFFLWLWKDCYCRVCLGKCFLCTMFFYTLYLHLFHVDACTYVRLVSSLYHKHQQYQSSFCSIFIIQRQVQDNSTDNWHIFLPHTYCKKWYFL